MPVAVCDLLLVDLLSRQHTQHPQGNKVNQYRVYDTWTCQMCVYVCLRVAQDDLDHQAHPIMCVVELPFSSTTTSSFSLHSQQQQQQLQPGSNSPCWETAAAVAACGSVIGVCVLDVASGQCHVGSFSTGTDSSRAGLAAVLLMHDPVECIAVRHNLMPATTALITRHCEIKGCSAGGTLSHHAGSSAAGKHVPGLSWLPVKEGAAVLGSPVQMLAEILPAGVMEQLNSVAATHGSISSGANGSSSVAARCGSAGGTAFAAVASALAVAVVQLQRCSLAVDVLPTLQLSALESLGKQPGHGPGEHQQQLTTAYVCRARQLQACLKVMPPNHGNS